MGWGEIPFPLAIENKKYLRIIPERFMAHKPGKEKPTNFTSHKRSLEKIKKLQHVLDREAKYIMKMSILPILTYIPELKSQWKFKKELE